MYHRQSIATAISQALISFIGGLFTTDRQTVTHDLYDDPQRPEDVAKRAPRQWV